jgi:hypothetical protein
MRAGKYRGESGEVCLPRRARARVADRLHPRAVRHRPADGSAGLSAADRADAGFAVSGVDVDGRVYARRRCPHRRRGSRRSSCSRCAGSRSSARPDGARRHPSEWFGRRRLAVAEPHVAARWSWSGHGMSSEVVRRTLEAGAVASSGQRAETPRRPTRRGGQGRSRRRLAHRCVRGRTPPLAWRRWSGLTSGRGGPPRRTRAGSAAG